DNWPSDDASDSKSCHILTSDSDESPPTTSISKSHLRPAGKAPALVSSTAWNIDTRRAGQSELGIEESPRKFWRRMLEPKLAKERAKKPCLANETKIMLSTTHHRTPPITISFKELNINYKGHNVITVTITFYYTYINANKPTKEAATAEQQGEIEARIRDGTVLSQRVCIRKAYALMRCPGLPCIKGDHCWQFKSKHYQLHPHHPLNGHEDVPETFRRLVLDDERDREAREEKEREEREKQRRRKRRRRDSDNTITIHCHSQQCTSGGCATPELVFPITPLMGFNEPREDLVRAYNMIISNQERMLKFYMDYDIPEGFTWRYVSDIRSFYLQTTAAGKERIVL
ncbi:hypothetical protein ACQKWADRAFT_297567, partial [Trichoderma austrokoningii]